MDADDGRASASIGIAQLLRAGVTTVAETTCTASDEEPIAETVMATGMRCVLARGQGDRTSRLASNYEQIDGRSWAQDDPGLLRADLAVCEEFVVRWRERGEGRLRLVDPQPRCSVVCSDERYLKTAEVARRLDTGA